MCINFNYDIIYKYVFATTDGDDNVISRITKKQMQEFTSKLEMLINENGKDDPESRYVNFNLDPFTKKSFFREYSDYFVDMDDYVLLIKALPQNTAESIETQYSSKRHVVDSLREAKSILNA